MPSTGVRRKETPPKQRGASREDDRREMVDENLRKVLREYHQLLRVLPVMLEQGSINFREFVFHGQMTEKKARELKAVFENEWGIFETQKVGTEWDFRLTKEGTELARIVTSMGPALEASRRKGKHSDRP